MFRYKIKSAFTLVELILVVVIMGVVYSIATSSINLKNYAKESSLNLTNLYSFLQSYSYEKSIALKCTEEKGCFIVSDGTIVEKIDNTLFKEKPIVYRYDQNFDVIEYPQIEIEVLESYDVVFEYSIDKYGKSKDMIVEVDDKVYIFNSFKNKVTIVDYTSDVNDYFDENIRKVRDAF